MVSTKTSLLHSGPHHHHHHHPPASCATARSVEWALSRLVEARHWAQYAVRRGATASSVTKFNTAILSFRQGHQVTEDCRHEDLIKLREGGLLLLDKLKQITLAWASFWKNVDSGQGEEEHFQQMEEVQLEEAGCKSQPSWTIGKLPLANVLTWRSSKMQLKCEADGVNGSIPRLRGRKKSPRFLENTCP